jgi:hypothetical protein
MSSVPEKQFTQREITLKDTSGNALPAIVEYGCRDWTEDGCRHTECRIALKWDGGEIKGIDWHFFESFRRVREQLALQDLYPVCYGASRQIVVTGMAIDMGLGLKVYKAQLGCFLGRNQLVHIFDSGTDVEPVSVEAQQEFQHEWVRSVKSK